MLTAAATRAIAAARIARFSRARGITFAAELLSKLNSALGAIRVIAVGFNYFLGLITAVFANKFYKCHNY